MTFVRTAMRRRPEWLNEWEEVDPLRNGCRCPQCGATCHGRQARSDHRDWHREAAAREEQLIVAVRKLCRRAGLNVVDADDADDLDDRLTAKARVVGQLDYDDDEEDVDGG